MRHSEFSSFRCIVEITTIHGGYGVKNYLFDLYPDFPDGFSLVDRKDPDSDSWDLYLDFQTIFFNSGSGFFPNGNKWAVKLVPRDSKSKGKKWFEIKLQISKGSKWIATFGLGTDYIGPSVNWAKTSLLPNKYVFGISDLNMSDDEIINFLTISRTIGGHLVFPRWISERNSDFINSSINKERGGKDMYFDRFDLTLFAIKSWYEGGPKERLGKVIEKNRLWFEQFGNFEGFINYFKLNDFVNGNYEIYDLTSFDQAKESYLILTNDKPWIPNNVEEYRKYVAGNSLAITLRNERLN